jgi:predicted RNA-binding protein with PIN domain
MAYVTAEVIPDQFGARHYMVILKHGEEIIGQWPVATKELGEKELLEALRELAQKMEEYHI